MEDLYDKIYNDQKFVNGKRVKKWIPLKYTDKVKMYDGYIDYATFYLVDSMHHVGKNMEFFYGDEESFKNYHVRRPVFRKKLG